MSRRASTTKIKSYNASQRRRRNGREVGKLLKAYEDSAQFYFDSAKAVADSALKYNTIAEGFPVKVTFKQFSTTDEDKSTLGGTVANSSDQTQTYT